MPVCCLRCGERQGEQPDLRPHPRVARRDKTAGRRGANGAPFTAAEKTAVALSSPVGTEFHFQSHAAAPSGTRPFLPHGFGARFAFPLENT